MNVIEFNQVCKKFKKGEKFNSLRDAIPNFLRRIISGNNGDLKEKEQFLRVLFPAGVVTVLVDLKIRAGVRMCLPYRGGAS